MVWPQLNQRLSSSASQIVLSLGSVDLEQRQPYRLVDLSHNLCSALIGKVIGSVTYNMRLYKVLGADMSQEVILPVFRSRWGKNLPYFRL